jgi:hypothetical protein
MGCIVEPGSKADREIQKAIAEGRVVRVTIDSKGNVRPITPAEAAKADAKLQGLFEFLKSLPES